MTTELPDCLSKACPLIPDLGPGPTRIALAESQGFIRDLSKIVLCATLAVYAANAVMVAMAARRWAKGGGLQRLRSAVRSGLPAGHGQRPPQDPLKEARVEQGVRAFNVEVRRKFTISLGAFCIVLLLVLIRRDLGDILRSLAGEPTDRFVAYVLFEASFPLCAIYLTNVCIVLSRPRLLDSRNYAIAVYVVMEVQWQRTLFYSLENVIAFDGYKIFEMMFRAFSLMGIGGTSLGVALNGPVAVAGLAMRWKNPTWHGCVMSVVYQEVFAFIFVCVVQLMLAGFVERQVRATLEAQSSRSLESAAESLMSGMCDAILHVSEDCEVLTASDSLAALLFAVSGAGLVGKKLTNFMQDDGDKEMLRRVLGKEQKDGNTAGALHVKLHDSCGTPVPVQIFHARCDDPFGQASFHIVGIREFSDGAAGRELPAAELAEGLEAPASAPQGRGRVAESISELSSVLSTEVVPISLMSESQSESAVEVVIDCRAEDEGYPIKRCTPEFLNRIGGPSLGSGAPLLHLVVDERDFVERLAQIVGTQLAGTRCEVEFPVRFQPRFIKQHVILASVSASLVEQPSAAVVRSVLDGARGKGSDEEIHVQLVLRDMQTRKAQRRRGRQARRGGVPNQAPVQRGRAPRRHSPRPMIMGL